MVRPVGRPHHGVPVAARPLDGVHGGVGRLEGLPGTGGHQLERRHPYRHGDASASQVHVARAPGSGRAPGPAQGCAHVRPDLVPDRQHELAGHGLGRPGVAVVQDDGELVPAQPGHEVPVPQVAAQGDGHLDDEPVTRLVAEGVVDGLEVVEVHDEQRPPGPLIGAGPQVVHQLQLEPAAVGQAREGVPGGQVAQGRLRALVPGDVHHVDEHVLGPSLGVAQDRRHHLAPAQAAPGADQAHFVPGRPPGPRGRPPSPTPPGRPGRPRSGDAGPEERPPARRGGHKKPGSLPPGARPG